MDLSKLKIGSPEATPSRANLVPRIKGAEWLDMVTEKMPEIQRPYCEPFVGDLYISYAFDLPGVFIMASQPHLKQLGIPLHELRGIAIENLRKHMTKLEFNDFIYFYSVSVGHNLEACVMLLDDVWKDFADHFENDLIATVPNRDIIMFCDSGVPEGMKALDDLGTEFYDKKQHSLSRGKFIWKDDKWEEYLPDGK